MNPRPALPKWYQVTLRDAGALVTAFVAALVSAIAVAGVPTTKAAVLAIIPGVAVLALRKVFPKLELNQDEVSALLNDLARVVGQHPSAQPTPVPASTYVYPNPGPSSTVSAAPPVTATVVITSPTPTPPLSPLDPPSDPPAAPPSS